jgi:cysteine desulfurase
MKSNNRTLISTLLSPSTSILVGIVIGVGLSIGTVKVISIITNIITNEHNSLLWDEENEDNLQIGSPLSATFLPEYKGCIYLDYNATTPVYPQVKNVIIPYLHSKWGNPSSNHAYAKPCKITLNEARKTIVMLLHVNDIDKSADNIIFTSCGTESDNRAIDIAINHFQTSALALAIEPASPNLTLKGKEKNKSSVTFSLPSSSELQPHIISSTIEHPAILAYLKHLESKGTISLTLVSVNSEGFVNINEIVKSLTILTALVTIMHSNNEVGTIQPIKEISEIINEFNRKENAQVLFHSDCAQSIGKVPVYVDDLGLDMVTIVGHKYGAPKGIAALFVREGTRTCPFLYGGGQEKGLRAGTENISLIAGLAKASELVLKEQDELILHMLKHKLRILIGLKNNLTENIVIKESHRDKPLKLEKDKLDLVLKLNGPIKSNDADFVLEDIKFLRTKLERKKNENNENNNNNNNNNNNEICLKQLPNTISISFKDVDASDLIESLSDKVACSAGSACHSNEQVISPVLKAMNIEPSWAFGTLRLSWGRHTTDDEIEKAITYIAKEVKRQTKKSTEPKLDTSVFPWG